MLKKIISASVVTAALLFSGCGSDSAGEDRLAAQDAIDNGNSGAAIALLEPTPLSDLNDTQKEAFLAGLNDTDKMTLASAYMQEADVSIMDIVSKLDTAEGENVTFASLSEDIIGDSNATETAEKIASIDTAIEYYESMGSSTVSSAPSYKASALTDSNITVEGAKLYLGMAYFSKVTMLLSFFGDVAALEDGSVSTYKDSYEATAEAIKCIYNSDCGAITGQTVGNTVDTGLTVSQFTISVNGRTFYRFATTATTVNNPGSMLIANYKTIDDLYTYTNQGGGNFSLTSDDMPFGGEYLFEDQILNALNGAYSLILDTAPDDVKDDMIDSFNDVDTDSSGDISRDEMIAYLNKQ